MRQEAVRHKLSHNIDGHAALLVGTKANLVRMGLRGGYIFKRIQTSGDHYHEKPDKNQYSHSMDALQYLLVEGCRIGGIKQGRRFGGKGSIRHSSLGTDKYWNEKPEQSGPTRGHGAGFSWNY